MPTFQSEQIVPTSIGDVFALLSRPANLIALAPPEMHLTIESGPEELHLGAMLTLRGRRWGMPHVITTEVVQFDPPTRLVDEQRKGPFKHWIHTLELETVAEGVCLRETIEFEPPGGMLGLMVTTERILRDLQFVSEHRKEKLTELLRERGIFP